MRTCFEMCGRQNTIPIPQCVPSLIPGTYAYIALHDKMDFADALRGLHRSRLYWIAATL